MGSQKVGTFPVALAKFANGVVYALRLFCFYLLSPLAEGSLPPAVQWIPPILTCADLVTRGQSMTPTAREARTPTTSTWTSIIIQQSKSTLTVDM